MQTTISFLRINFPFGKFPYLTILSNTFLGYALGSILITPGDEMTESIVIKVLLILGTCFFANYLVCLRKAASGITRSIRGKLRPFLKEALLCAALNAAVLLLSITLFFFKCHSL
jgi:hypothetical protein